MEEQLSPIEQARTHFMDSNNVANGFSELLLMHDFQHEPDHRTCSLIFHNHNLVAEAENSAYSFIEVLEDRITELEKKLSDNVEVPIWNPNSQPTPEAAR